MKPVAKLEELPEGSIRKVVVDGKEIALYNVGGRIFATGTICPHQGGPLDEGELDGRKVICPWHGWMFNLEDGTAVMNPNIRIPTYPVKVENGQIFLQA